MQGFNRYYPATYDPADKAHKGNLNRLAGKPAQSNVVRFEMPFNVWCSHCSKLISQGNRFNASKRQAGRYLSTPIWHFTLKCHHCTGFIEIQTNPKETSYDVLSGGVRKAEEWDAKANGALVTETLYRSDDDAVTQLEAESIRRQTRAETSAHLSQLAAANKRWTDEYRASQVLRKRFRDEKKQRQLTSKKCKEVERRFGLAVDVLGLDAQDTITAKGINFAVSSGKQRQGLRPKDALRRQIVGASHSSAAPTSQSVNSQKRYTESQSLVEYASSASDDAS